MTHYTLIVRSFFLGYFKLFAPLEPQKTAGFWVAAPQREEVAECARKNLEKPLKLMADCAQFSNTLEKMSEP
jgi:hypothetical protein